MRPTGCYKDFDLPLNGGLDTRSPSGRVQFTDFRLILNMDGSEQRGYCRMGGWQPYLKDSELGFKNQDLHDQMSGGQYYHRSYAYSYTSPATITGYHYSLFFPEVSVGGYTLPGPTIGPFCGYALDVPYLFADAVNDWNISDWFAGSPYNYVLDAQCVGDGDGGPGTPPGSGDWVQWTVSVRSTAFTANRSHLVAAELAWDSVLFGSDDVTQTAPDGPAVSTHVFTFCVPPDATNVRVISFAGNLLDGPTKTATVCLAAATENHPAAPCVDSNCYIGSYYYLTYTYGYDGYTIPAYSGGDTIPVYADAVKTTEEGCYPELYYLQSVCREAITGLFPLDSVGGRRRLVATTRSRIYVNDDRNGNWRILADGLGGGCAKDDDCTCSSKRFRIAALGNTVLFTNGVDPVLAWEFDAKPAGCFFWSADYVAQLRQLSIDSAEVVQSWNGFAFIGNVSENGDKFASRFYWSDYNDPMSWIPGGNSLAGFHDFGNGERILAMEPIGGRLRIFTDKAIYDCILVRDVQQVFSIQEIYRGPNVLRYAFALVNTGDTLVWMGESSLYVMAEYDRTPQRIEWIHQASGVIYDGVRAEWVEKFDGLPVFGGVNKNQCNQAVGGWDSMRQAIWFSWPTDDNVCPNMSLVLWPRYAKASIVDQGFTAFANYRPDFRQSIRDFLWTRGFCEALDLLLDKEGVPYSYGGGEYYQYLFNEQESTAYPMDPNSAIASLCGVCLYDICESCDVDVRFLMASAVDKTIKEFTPDQCVREMLSSELIRPFPDTSVASYVDNGYYSMMQGDPYDYNTPVEKLIVTATLNYVATIQTTPNNLYYQVSFGMQPECQSWADTDPVPLECIDGPDFDDTTNERPGDIPRFAFYNAGSFLGWRFYTFGTGGKFCTTSTIIALRRNQGCW